MGDTACRTRVLLADDDPSIAPLVRRAVAEVGFESLTVAGTGRAALDALEEADIVLLDHGLPDAAGLDILDEIRTRPNAPAVVMITAYGSESLAAAALRRGADDYLAKDASLPSLLPQILERVRRNRELKKALSAAEENVVRAERLAAIGEMTVTLHHGLNNPLMAATADVDLLLTDTPMTEAARRESLESIRTSLHRIRDLVRRVGALREVGTSAYLSGIRMVDVERGPAGISPSRGTALMLVPDHDLARVVALLLSDAGFSVSRCADADELVRMARSAEVTLALVLGGSGTAGAHALAGWVPPRERSYRVVALAAGEPGAARDAGADFVIRIPFDPVAFTAEMTRLVP
jgi:DNA-binding response OmpR family regulator